MTRACFDEYHRLFGIRYPFGEYHQVFVPEFNAGAMENPGCVTFRDSMVFRGAATPDQVLQRSNTIAHEMAHMWFGDLVTMRWWDDLWLNESFAEYMAYRVTTTVTEFTDAWVEFGVARKMWGYAAERAPSTHPVAGSPAPDARSALGNFDGISYAKGASVLRQLIAHIGDEAFLAGVREHLSSHAFGNGELAEFVAAMEEASRPLARRVERGLARDVRRRPVDRGGRGAPADARRRPTPPTVRTRSTSRRSPAAPRWRVSRSSPRAAGPRCRGSTGCPRAPSWCRTPAISPGPRSRSTTRRWPAWSAGLPEVPDAQARAVLWVALLGSVHRAEVDPRVALDVFASAWPRETSARPC